MRIYYNPNLKELSRKLRQNSTVSEVLLWQHLKNRQMHGFDFHRQKPIDEFIVDFFCPRLKLIIEIDGITHNERLSKDSQRQEKLEALGFTFLRFLDSDIKENLEGVLFAIEEWINEHKS